MNKIKLLILSFVLIASILVYFYYSLFPKYKEYQFFRNEKNIIFNETGVLLNSISAYYSHYHRLPILDSTFIDYIASLNDKVDIESLHLFKYGIGLNSNDAYFYLYAIGPDKKDDGMSKVLNPIENDTIKPLQLSFVEFLKAKGDILLGYHSMENVCDMNFKNVLFFKNGQEIKDDTLRRMLHKTMKKFLMNYLKIDTVEKENIEEEAKDFYFKGLINSGKLKMEFICNPLNEKSNAIIDSLQAILSSSNVSGKVDSFYFPVKIFGSSSSLKK